MSTQADYKTHLDYSLDSFQKILDFAKTVEQQEQQRCETETEGHFIGQVSSAFAVNALERELNRFSVTRTPAEKTTLEVETLEHALVPFLSLHAILDRGGECGLQIDSNDMAVLFGALLHSAYTRIGHPRAVGDML